MKRAQIAQNAADHYRILSVEAALAGNAARADYMSREAAKAQRRADKLARRVDA